MFSYEQTQDIKKIINTELNYFRKYVGIPEMDQNINDILQRVDKMENKLESLIKKIESKMDKTEDDEKMNNI